MIIGEVTPEREAVIRLSVRGPGGQEAAVTAILDTGFTEYLTLSPTTVTALHLPFREAAECVTANDRAILPTASLLFPAGSARMQLDAV